MEPLRQAGPGVVYRQQHRLYRPVDELGCFHQPVRPIRRMAVSVLGVPADRAVLEGPAVCLSGLGGLCDRHDAVRSHRADHRDEPVCRARACGNRYPRGAVSVPGDIPPLDHDGPVLGDARAFVRGFCPAEGGTSAGFSGGPWPPARS